MEAEEVYFERLLSDMGTYVHSPCSGGRAPHKCAHEKQNVHHGGNLREHALWTFHTIILWKSRRAWQTEGVDVYEARVAALLHDVGKGGDCVERCDADGECWRDTYAPQKYGGASARTHTLYGAEMFTGERPYILDCDTGETVDVGEMVRSFDPNISTRRLAVVAYMHYDFGLVGIELDEESYVQKFFRACKKYKVRPSLGLLKLVIAISAADIAGASNRHLNAMVRRRVPMLYNSFEPWTRYKIDVKGKELRCRVLETYRRLKV